MKRKLTYLLAGACLGWALPHLAPAARAGVSEALALAGYHRGMIVADGRLTPQLCRMGKDGVTLACAPKGAK